MPSDREAKTDGASLGKPPSDSCAKGSCNCQQQAAPPQVKLAISGCDVDTCARQHESARMNLHTTIRIIRTFVFVRRAVRNSHCETLSSALLLTSISPCVSLGYTEKVRQAKEKQRSMQSTPIARWLLQHTWFFRLKGTSTKGV